MPGSDEARAIALLEHLALLCAEARDACNGDASRVTETLNIFEDTLATLAPVLERVGREPSASRDAVLAAAQNAANGHTALMEAMGLELDRLRRAVLDSGSSATAALAYGQSAHAQAHSAFTVFG